MRADESPAIRVNDVEKKTDGRRTGTNRDNMAEDTVEDPTEEEEHSAAGDAAEEEAHTADTPEDSVGRQETLDIGISTNRHINRATHSHRNREAKDRDREAKGEQL